MAALLADSKKTPVGSDTWPLWTSGILRSGFGESSASSALPTLLTGVCSSIWNYLSTHINEIATAHLLAVCAGLCISAGSGGGGLFVPILIAMVGMEVHTATSASQILIFGSSMAGVCYDLTQRHPERERPLIDLSVILFLAPVMMAGALVGSVVSTTMPPSLVMLLLVIACSAAAYKSLRKGFRLWQTENQMDIDVMDTMEPINPIALLTCASGDAVAGTPSIIVWIPLSLYAEVKACEKSSPCKYFFGMGKQMLALVIETIGIDEDGKGTKSVLRVEYCGEVYWVVTFSAIIMLLGVAFFSAKDLFSMHQHKIACHYPFAKGDPHWNMSYLRRMCFITFGTGIAAGVLGVGGGMFLSPVLFELGMLPMVVAAISTSCILLSSSVLTVLIIVQGTVGLSTVFLYFLGTVAGAFLGKFFVKQIVAKYRSSAIIPLILAVLDCVGQEDPSAHCRWGSANLNAQHAEDDLLGDFEFLRSCYAENEI
eukprot:jgi/Bigna1/79547/fgenesh1_pg.63_\